MEHELAGRLAGGPVAGKEHVWKAAVGQQERTAGEDSCVERIVKMEFTVFATVMRVRRSLRHCSGFSIGKLGG